MAASPYLFRAAEHPLTVAGPRLRVREAASPFGITLRYQERDPGEPEPADPGSAGEAWCETGHSIFILSGRIRYRFHDHEVEAGPGDMLHIPAGRPHRHIPSVIGEETVRYVLTEFTAADPD
jgi:hypothetical protein